MLGREHRKFNLRFGILCATILIGVLGFGIEFAGVVPVCWYTATLPDIDQKNSTPREWKKIKLMMQILIFGVLLLAVGMLIYNLYQYFVKHIPLNGRSIGISTGILLFYYWIAWYSKRPTGKILTSHRGFTHTLVIPILLLLLFYQIDNTYADTQLKVAIFSAIKVLIMGVFCGIIGHIFLDMTCKAGVPLLYPIPIFEGSGTNKRYKRIKIGNAISGDPNVMGKSHKTAIRATNFWSIVSILATIGIIVYKVYVTNFAK